MAELIREDDTLNQGRKKLNNAIKAFNETVVEGDSSVEAAQARVDEKGQSHDTLKDRIDDGFTKVNSQLAETTVEVNNLKTDKMNKSEGVTKNELAREITDTKTYLDSQLSQIGNMSPRGAFSTLQALKSAHPNGSEGVFIVQDNGHWYYWDDNEWVVGGLYQAQPWDSFMTTQDEEWVI